MKDFIGQTLGQYYLESLLGSGGMGQVYKGVHKLLNRPAAIKVMLPHYAANEQFRARFLQEARAAAALRHPNIVEIYEFGEQDGVLFLVLELLNDGSLSSLLKRQNGQPLPLPLALDLGSQIAQGLAAAHTMQVIHRDIKPANLLLRRQPGSAPGQDLYTLKINDFGLARLLEGGIETATGAPMGTLAYMSPEQCIGARQLDGRSDLYSLGVVLYEITTGYLPFQITGVTDAFHKHVNVPPPAPRSVRPDLPPMVEEIILRCLAKKPEERFANGTALATALQSVLGNSGASQPSLSTRSSQAYPTRTTLESPAVVETPPTVGTISGYADVPRVRVVDQHGQTLQVIEVKAQGLLVGRQVGNDIVLASQAVSRQHLQISWNGQQVSVKDLGSSNGTILGESRLLPNATQVWEERQMIRLGSFWLRLEGASAPLTRAGQSVAYPQTGRYSAPTVGSSSPSRVGVSSPSLVNERIGIQVAPKTLTITPGQTATVQITLTNMGSTVDWFTPVVEGVPAEWVQGSGQEVQLNPGMQETVSLVVNVTRNPVNRARDYSVTIRVGSREQPQQFSTTKAVWVVQPFKEDAMRLEPRRATGRGKADYNVLLRNGSNQAARYTLHGDDDEQQLTYHFTYNPVDLDVGQEARIPLQVVTKKHLLGRERRVPFQLHAGPINTPPTQTIPGEFINKAVLPGWVVPVVAALLAAGVVASSLFGILPFPGRGASANPVPTRQIGQNATPQVTPSPGITPSPGLTPTPTPSPSPTVAVSPTPAGPPHPNNSTPLQTGLGGVIGSQYVARQDSLYFVEYNGNFSVLRNASRSHPSYSVLGTGYITPEEVYITADEGTAYITERSGDLVKVNLSGDMNRSSAIPVASGLTEPHQFAVDETRQIAYVIEYGSPGSLVSVNLQNGTVTPVLTTLQNPIGALLSPDGASIYISEQWGGGGGQISRYSLTSPGSGVPLATASTSTFFFLQWADMNHSALLTTERRPSNKVWYLSLLPGSTLQHVADVSDNPSSVAVISASSTLPILVCSDSEIDKLS